MKNAKRWFGILVVILIISTVTLGLVSCNHQKLDQENRTLSMSIQEPDGVFNPFFSTSAYDSSIISLTQISMFNTDKEGTLVAGLNEPTVALDYTQQAVDSEGNPVYEDSAAAYTDYAILIKNGIKFSDGKDLTIQDVLFNLYVYLDPVFTGSATIYSTDIVGLSAYRTQEEDTDDSSLQNFEERFINSANIKLRNLISWVAKFCGVDPLDNTNALSVWDGDATHQNPTWDSDYEFVENQGDIGNVKTSFAHYRELVNNVASLYMDELTSDWNGINITDYQRKPDEEGPEEETGFTDVWQVFMYTDMGNTDILQKAYGDSGSALKTPQGKYKLNTTKALEEYNNIVPENIRNMADGQEKQDAIKKCFIEEQFKAVFPEYQTHTDSYGVVTYEVNVPSIKTGSAGHTPFESVVTEWATSNTVWDNLVAEAKSDYFGDDVDSLAVPNISGVTVSKTTNFKGKNYSQAHYVLNIRINKVDPKALMNFAFTVAPMHYYSNDEQIALFNADFQKWEAAGANPQTFNDKELGVTHFGVKFGDPDFMNNEINSKTKIGVPIGAGSYQASNDRGEEDVTKVTSTGATGFKNNNLIYYVRNNYFWTVGADGGSEKDSQLHNAYIKKIAYKVTAADQIISSLAGNNIDLGDPSATKKNEDELKSAGLEVVRIRTAGYGYIGINPRYVPEVAVRRAIMKAMDINQIINNYYEGKMAERIYRPMSMTSWAYPKDAGIYSWDTSITDGTTDLSFDATGEQIRALVESAGYTGWNKPGDLYYKGNKTLDIKFTIAGASTDHPAYKCFLDAQKLLNANGFNIQVVTSQQALSDLSAGKLAVWAAAWSSAIDPDMYQVYHINSQASSTSNWGYKQIKADQTTYGYEYNLIAGNGLDPVNGYFSLSDLIDQARETNDQDSRAEIYAKALDTVMALAVELPTYQRNDITAYNAKVIDKNSLPNYDGSSGTIEVSPYYGILARIWDVRYV